MDPRLKEYQEFIDALGRIRPAVEARWVTETGWPRIPENAEINRFISGLPPDQKKMVARMLQQARDAGIHDVLAYLTDKINTEGLRISRNGTELAREPYGSEMDYDWICRCDGAEWPEDQLDSEYRSRE